MPWRKWKINIKYYNGQIELYWYHDFSNIKNKTATSEENINFNEENKRHFRQDVEKEHDRTPEAIWRIVKRTSKHIVEDMVEENEIKIDSFPINFG